MKKMLFLLLTLLSFGSTSTFTPCELFTAKIVCLINRMLILVKDEKTIQLLRDTQLIDQDFYHRHMSDQTEKSQRTARELYYLRQLFLDTPKIESICDKNSIRLILEAIQEYDAFVYKYQQEEAQK